MTVQEAIEIFREKVATDEVMNLKTGRPGPVTPRDVSAILSCTTAAFSFASGKSDLSQIPYDAYADRLDQFARAEAEERGLIDGANRANRCRRFVATVDGFVRQRRRLGANAVPEEWTDLYNALRNGELASGNRVRKAGFLVDLAQRVAIAGIRSPADLPTKDKLESILRREGDSRSTYDAMLNAYREARKLYLEANPQATLPNIDRCPITTERGLRSLPNIVELLEAKGYDGAVGDLPVADVIRLLAPTWYRVMDAFIEAEAKARSRDFPKKVIGASSRFLAALVRSGHGELESAHPTQFLLRWIDTGELVEDVIDGEEWELEFADDPAHLMEPETGGARETLKVRLFELLAYEMAHESAENSPLTVVNGAVENGPPFWTETVINDVRLIGQMGLKAGERSRIFRNQPALEADTHLAVGGFLLRMKKANSRVSFNDRKAKALLLDLVTLPMVVCLGLPRLRSSVLNARREWRETLLRYGGDSAHPRVRRSEEEYDRQLTSYLIFATFIADGLRLANYSGARLGPCEYRTRVEDAVPDGSVVGSYCHIYPMLAPDGAGLIGVKTNFFGDDHEQVKLKIDKVPGSDEWREHPHWLRPGIVDMELLWDYLVRVRPKRLAAQGLIESVLDYDLQRDIDEQHFALFVSDKASTDDYRAVTGAYVPDAISESFGRTLHRICTEVLGRRLPPFGPELRQKYARVFSAHSSRLLLGTYLYGILGKKNEAAVLLNDTPQMVERRYSVVEASMVHKQGWEHPHFFDSYFDRIWNKGEVIDWSTEDPLKGELNLPPGLRKAA